MRAAGVIALVLLAPLAGCLGAGDEAPGTTATDEDLAAADAAANDEASRTATSPADMTGGHAPHIHNYWGESDRVTLFDGPVEATATEFFPTFVNLLFLRQPAVGGVFWDLPDGATVYEGTGLMEVTVTWTDPTITGLQLYYKAADKQFERDGYAGPVVLTKDTVASIPIEPGMTDMPHEAVSRWSFYFAPAGTPSIAQGSFDLKVDIIRMRDVMEFPGHPDNFEDVSHYVLSDRDFTYKSPAFYSSIVALVVGGEGREAIAPDAIVPMETTHMLFEVALASGSSTAPLAKQNGVYMLYTAADGRQVYEGQLLNATEDGVYVFGIPVEETGVDSPYADESAWRFYLWLETESTVGPTLCGPGCYDAELTGHLKILAFDEDPTGGSIGAAKEYEGN